MPSAAPENVVYRASRLGITGTPTTETVSRTATQIWPLYSATESWAGLVRSDGHTHHHSISVTCVARQATCSPPPR
jgi:hypothetical protein